MDPIEEIKQKLDVVTFIQPYVPLKQAGRNWKGLCPFHGEKTPSFMVSQERQTWHCFGCGKGGDVISFYQQIENLDFYEALKSLAERTGVVLKYQEPEKTKQRNSLYEINALAAKFFHYLLTKHAIGRKALAYVTKERMLLSKTVDEFQIGYAPAKWDELLKFLRKHKITERQAYEAGLASKNAKGYFDMFRDRVMFPLFDHRGNIVGFAGRLLDKDAKMAKYINTPETPIYIKGNTLFGLYQNTNAIKEAGSAILAEGELDVLSSIQAGVRNVIAVKGTALTQNQLTLLRRYTQTLILAMDQDSAGQQATRRSIELALGAGFSVRVTSLPFGKDVDDLAKQSPKQWQNAVETAQPYYEWLINHVLKKYDLHDPFAKNKATQEILPFLQAIDNEIIREHYYKLLAKQLDTNYGTLIRVGQKLRTRPSQVRQTEMAKDNVQLPKDIANLQYLLALLLQSQQPQQYLRAIANQFHPADLADSAEKKLWQAMVDEWQTKKTAFNHKQFLQSLPQELAGVIDIISLMETNDKLFSDPLVLETELLRTAKEIKTFLVKQKLKLVLKQIGQYTDTTDSQLLKLTQEMHQLQSELKET